MRIPPVDQLSDKCGFSRAHIQRVLSGKKDPSLTCARKLASSIGVSLGTFVNYLDHTQQTKAVSLWPVERE